MACTSQSKFGLRNTHGNVTTFDQAKLISSSSTQTPIAAHSIMFDTTQQSCIKVPTFYPCIYLKVTISVPGVDLASLNRTKCQEKVSPNRSDASQKKGGGTKIQNQFDTIRFGFTCRS